MSNGTMRPARPSPILFKIHTVVTYNPNRNYAKFELDTLSGCGMRGSQIFGSFGWQSQEIYFPKFRGSQYLHLSSYSRQICHSCRI